MSWEILLPSTTNYMLRSFGCSLLFEACLIDSSKTIGFFFLKSWTLTNCFSNKIGSYVTSG